MNLTASTIPETLPELAQRIQDAGCRIVRCHQAAVDLPYEVIIANRHGAEVTKRADTIQEALKEAFGQVILISDAA